MLTNSKRSENCFTIDTLRQRLLRYGKRFLARKVGCLVQQS